MGRGSIAKNTFQKSYKPAIGLMDLHSKFATEDIGFMNTQYCFVKKYFDFLRVKEIESVSISFAYCSCLAILS